MARPLSSLSQAGYTLPELLLVLAIGATAAGMAVPLWSSAIDHMNASAAARLVAGRIATARLEAVRRSSVVALMFEPRGDDYAFRPVLDGNGNGLRAADVTAGIDVATGPSEQLSEHFGAARFGLLPGLPDIDGASGNADGVRIGSSSFLSLTPLGTATAGTLYVHGRRAQFAVRIVGATGRTRVFFYDTGVRKWIPR